MILNDIHSRYKLDKLLKALFPITDMSLYCDCLNSQHMSLVIRN